jgi:lipopolysaccharide biosynthesis glycosyltransferase
LFVILINVDERNRSILRELAFDRALVKLTFIQLASSIYSQFPVNGHISWATYARIFIPDLVPASITKALYLDCDLYVADSIRPLWDTDITHYAVGAVVDPLIDRHAALELPMGSPYYNAGVLLMNLELWRRDKLVPKIIEYINSHASILKFHDQDALNAFLHERILALDPRWNVLHSFFEETAENVHLSSEMHTQLRNNPGIVHFTSDRKPWFLFNKHPFRRHYWRILQTTPYRHYRPPLLSARKALPEKYRLGTLLARIKGKK